jgi:tRNA dimethylallyltransferase
MSSPARLAVILGPTASGKSALAIALAEKLNGEVVVCDSTQVYRRFNIGTAKVPHAERKGIPHWMMDLVEPHEVFTAGDYRRRAEETLRDIHARGHLPIVTAGTGLYLRALLEGLADAPTRSEELRARLRERSAGRGPEYLHRLLRRLDPNSAARIAPRDSQKLIRAIEMRVLAKKPVDEIHAAGRAPLEGFAPIKIGLKPPRAALYSRIEQRIDQMLATGWQDEIRKILKSGIEQNAKPFTFIGYRELLPHLSQNSESRRAPIGHQTPPQSGSGIPDSTINEIRKSTRHFAKRQLTWFARESNVHWLPNFGDDPAALKRSLVLLA